MHVSRGLALSILIFAMSGSGSAAGGIDTSRLNLVEENHAELEIAGEVHVLDTYIVLFERPYYIHVRKLDGTPLSEEGAASIAAEYITPRGCTTPLARRGDLDKSNAAKTQWLIGIEC